MLMPKGFYTIYQPKYRTPSAFDLNEKGIFKTRPGLTQDWGFRMIASDALEVQLQFVCLVDFNQPDPKTGEAYVCKTVNELIPVDGELNPDADLLAQKVDNERIREELIEELVNWRSNYLPLDENGKADPDKLKEKISASLEEAKTALCKRLVVKNDPWVRSAVPFLVQQFRRGLYRRAGGDLADEYKNSGGQDDEKGLVRKTMLFFRVLENCNDPELVKPDGGRWQDEDEIWQTWVGYAGSEDEAKRICRSLDTVLVPLAREMEIETAR